MEQVRENGCRYRGMAFNLRLEDRTEMPTGHDRDYFRLLVRLIRGDGELTPDWRFPIERQAEPTPS